PDQPIVTFTGTPTSGTYLIANTQAAAALTVENVTFDGANAADFSIVTPLPLVVPAGSSAPLEVRFNPSGPNGIKTANMTVVSNDPQQPSYPPIVVRARRSVGVFFAAHYKLDDTSGTAALNSAVTGSATFEVRDPLAFSRESLIGGTGTSIGFLPAQTGTTGNYFVSTITHTPTYSVSMWIKPEDTGAIRTLFQRDPDFVSPVDGIYGLLLNPDGALTYRVADADVVPGNISIPNGEIHHVVLTHLDTDGFGNTTANRIRLYVDGQLAGQAIAEDAKGFLDYPFSPTASGLHFGSRTTAGNGYQGDMDDVQVFSAELSPEQVWDLYRHPGLIGPNAATLSTTAVTYTPPGGPGGATGLVNLTWRSNPSIQYSIISSTDLTNWTAPGVITAFGTPDSDTTSLSVPANGPLRYYRITAP
ncbi:MAG: hypothetical protein JWL81_133, partial [Verrucomicrobiales bacterium]|nr:hypothetical protein [Verrucomicrobiales bacterium]